MTRPDLSRATWRKSSFSGSNVNCVEVAFTEGYVALRHSRDPNGAVLVLDAKAWRSLIDFVKGGGTDLT